MNSNAKVFQDFMIDFRKTVSRKDAKIFRDFMIDFRKTVACKDKNNDCGEQDIQELPRKDKRIRNTMYIKNGEIRFWDGKILKCRHKKQIQMCKDCGGSQICKHVKQKRTCKECRGYMNTVK